ncbi:MAG: molybdate ABC transporter substrate-binding protein [Kofleriaceae bacterium]
MRRALILVALLAGCSSKDGASTTHANRPYEGHVLELFVGTASKPPTEAAAAAFEQKTGAKLELHFGGSGRMLSEMKLAERGDIYFPGSSDYMEKAEAERLVVPETEQRIVYLIPAINVQRGNPHHIQRLEDLAQPGLRVGIARPDTVCVGLYGVELLEHAKLADKVKPNIVTNAESCEQTAELVSLKSVDAVLGWEVFEHWDPDHIETVYLPKDEVTRIGYIPAAVGTKAREPALAKVFIAFLASAEGKAIFKKWSYLTSEAEARVYTNPSTPVGGVYELPASWQQ